MISRDEPNYDPTGSGYATRYAQTPICALCKGLRHLAKFQTHPHHCPSCGGPVTKANPIVHKHHDGIWCLACEHEGMVLDVRHGLRGYRAGCRCDRCRRAKREEARRYNRERWQREKARREE